MAVRVRSVALALALALAAAGCGPQAQKPAAPGETTPSVASIESQLDPCQDKAGFAQKVCQDPTLAPVAQKIRAALAEAAGSISEEGDKLIVDSQKAWLETQALACGVDKDKPDAATCLKTALDARIQDAKAAVEQKGGFTFQRVEVNQATATTAEAAAASGLGDDAPPAITRELRYPRIDGATTAAVQRFNEIMAKMGQPRTKLEDATSENSDYTITFASPQLVSVQFISMEYALGAAHPNNGLTSVTVLMNEGRQLEAADVFKAGSGWEAFLTRRSMKSLTKTLQDFGAGPPAITDVRDTATKVHNWTIAEDGLVVLFPPYSIGPGALGGQEVKIPWKDLAPFVNPAAPPPINAPKPS